MIKTGCVFFSPFYVLQHFFCGGDINSTDTDTSTSTFRDTDTLGYSHTVTDTDTYTDCWPPKAYNNNNKNNEKYLRWSLSSLFQDDRLMIDFWRPFSFKIYAFFSFVAKRHCTASPFELDMQIKYNLLDTFYCLLIGFGEIIKRTLNLLEMDFISHEFSFINSNSLR